MGGRSTFLHRAGVGRRDGRDRGGGVLDAPVRGSLLGGQPGKRLSELPPTAAREKRPPANARAPVPQTDTGGPAEHAEAIGRTVVKELGKMAP